MADSAPITLLLTGDHETVGGFAPGKLADRAKQIADRAVLAVAADVTLERGIERLLADDVDDAAGLGPAIEHRRGAGEQFDPVGIGLEASRHCAAQAVDQDTRIGRGD